MQEWAIQIPSIPILVSVVFPSLQSRIKFLLPVINGKVQIDNSSLLSLFMDMSDHECAHSD